MLPTPIQRPRRSVSAPPEDERIDPQHHLLGRAEQVLRSRVDESRKSHHSPHKISLAESLEDFPDASFTNRKPPYIPGQRRRLESDL